ncbi:hypothetical protein RHSIM_Rhsim08G0080400 [Rhododendron simsii]|uniref:Trichome birefringence-like N-terminal domain-containing protein n=1 Tax=Rhododendron simsii TaxID=118357 RepID=A0A834GI28_RHOSS|nr:hypothetical protein RHSIM_Rhsim08G0080400 [Rhododendron simsii]
MKLQAVELPLMKNQTRRIKTPKVATLVAVALLLLTIIPIYYPFFRYPNKNPSSDLSSSSRISSQLPLCSDGDSLPERNGLCTHKDVEKIPTTNDNELDSPGNDVEKPPTLSSNSNGGGSTFNWDKEIKSILRNPELAGNSQPDEGVIEDTEMKPALNNPDSVDTTESGEDVTAVANDRGVKTEPVTSNSELAETTQSGEAFNRDVEMKPVLSNPDSAETTQSGEDTTRTPSNRDVETNHARGDLDSVETSDSSSGMGETTIDRKTETKPVQSNPDLEDTTHTGRDEAGVGATDSGNSMEETTINRKTETKPVLSNPDLEETTQSGRDEAAATTLPPEKDAKKTGAHRRRDVGRSPPPPNNAEYSDSLRAADSERENCDIFTGEWVPNPEAPYYTNATCREIQQHQDCLKFGRPDTRYLKWKWKPEGCELPVFDPYRFLQLVRGKSLAFVGDSVARNHMQSLICLLSRVEEAVDVSDVKFVSQFKRYEYPNHNFTVEIFWSPYLVKTTQSDDARPFNLYLDEFDEKWTTKIQHFDYVIISAGHWFFRPTMFYVQGRIVGCLYCPESHITHLTSYFSYRRAFRTAFRAINSLENFKGTTFLRTFAPSHFEGGYWDQGGDCRRKTPFKKAEARLEGYNLEHHKIQVEEVKIAERLGRRKGLKFRLFDVTQAMLLRPDGHPSKYGHWPQQNVTMANDCVHWCLPGPVDTWNDFLIEMLKREEKASY